MTNELQIDKIIVIADMLRHTKGCDGTADIFYGLLNGVLNRVTNLPITLLSSDELIDIQKEIYQSYGHDIESVTETSTDFCTFSSELWSQLCFAEPNDKVINITKKYFSNSLVVCREPALVLIKAFKQINIPYIEFAIHSARFLDDLIMGITSNVDSVYEKLKKYELNSEYLYLHADILSAEAARRLGVVYNPLDKNSAVFFAQTPEDRSLLDVKRKKIVTLFDYKEKFESICKSYDTVYYKSHPFYTNKEIISYIASFPNTKILDSDLNTYHILSSPNIKLCCSISSGTVNEARFFAKQTESFLNQPYHYSDEITDKSSLDKYKHYITISKHFYASYFWSDILASILTTKKIQAFPMDHIKNKFRRILKTSWGYDDCDSQFIENIIKDTNNTHYSKSVNLLGFNLITIVRDKISTKYRFLNRTFFKMQSHKNYTQCYFLKIPFLKIFNS